MKRKNTGSALVAVLGFIGVLVAAAVFVVVTYIKFANSGVTQEQMLKATWEENTAVLNNYTVKVQEVAQVPDMFKNDLREVISDTFTGRYGDGGSKAVFQFIQENNMNLDPVLYRQIQQVMEAGRNEFLTSQRKLIDVKMNYEAQLNYVWSGFWLGVAGYPKVDLNKYQIIKLDDVARKMESGQDSVIKLR